MKTKVIIVGGGAAGFFAAANLASENLDVLILEQSSQFLQKVKLSGGGRCNITHACFDPNELVQFYPRGHKELRSVFHHFQPADTFNWFEQRGLALKTEDDGRVFPESDHSEDVIKLLLQEARKNHVQFVANESLLDLKKENELWKLKTTHQNWTADVVVFATGSSARSLKLIENLGHKIVKAVPSLFTFNIKNPIIEGLMGVSFPRAVLRLPELKLEESGPLLITHWGLSGPAVLKLSAWGAREMAIKNHHFVVFVDFIGLGKENALEQLFDFRKAHPKKSLYHSKIFDLNTRFWHQCLKLSQISETKTNADLSKKEMETLCELLCNAKMQVKGRSVHKDEFVTAGGVDLKEINFKSMQSKQHPKLYLAGEVLDIDAVTGGFNFQACWSEAWLLAQHIVQTYG